jgi:hypothetical protein
LQQPVFISRGAFSTVTHTAHDPARMQTLHSEYPAWIGTRSSFEGSALQTVIERCAPAEHVTTAVGWLNGMIRRRLGKLVEDSRTRLIELGPQSHWLGQLLLITSKALEQLPGVAVLCALLGQVQSALNDLVTGHEVEMLRGMRMLQTPRFLETCAPFVASLMLQSGQRSSADLTFCYEQQQLLFLRSEEVSLVRIRSTVELAVRRHGHYRIAL